MAQGFSLATATRRVGALSGTWSPRRHRHHERFRDHALEHRAGRRQPVDRTRPSGARDAVRDLDRVAASLREEFQRRGKEAVFDGLKDQLIGDHDRLPYLEIGARLGLSEVAARVAVHRLRRRFGELLRREIGETVNSPEDIEDEIQYLMRAVAR